MFPILQHLIRNSSITQVGLYVLRPLLFNFNPLKTKSNLDYI